MTNKIEQAQAAIAASKPWDRDGVAGLVNAATPKMKDTMHIVFDPEELDAIAATLNAREAELRAEVEGLRRDAARWRAVIGSARVRNLGSAGLSGAPLDPNGSPWNGYAHIGMEFWTKHDCTAGNAYGAEMFTRYADAAIDAAMNGEGGE